MSEVWRCWGCDVPTPKIVIVGGSCVAACSPACGEKAHRALGGHANTGPEAPR